MNSPVLSITTSGHSDLLLVIWYAQGILGSIMSIAWTLLNEANQRSFELERDLMKFCDK